jgi:gliding motility-associated-like protein
VSSITVTPTTADVNATVKVNGTLVTSGTASGNLPLVVGPNTVTIVVTAQDVSSTKTYTITVTRVASTVATLASIKLSNGSVSPAFAPGTTSYTDAVGNSVTSITVTPTSTDANATIMVNGSAVMSGSASPSIPLVVGPNNITIAVTAQDGVTQQSYTVVVTEAASTNANLSSLVPNTGSISPVFSPTTINYTETVGNNFAGIKVTPTTAVSSATIKVNGITVASGALSQSIPLAVGSNKVTIIVTAQSGATKTYTLTVTRAAGPEADYDPGIIASKPAVVGPTLADDGIVVHQGITPNGDGINDVLQIENISQYPDNKVSIINRNGQLVYEAAGYDNTTRVFDGHSNKNGKMQLPGTYYYQLDYTVNGITKHKTGYLVLKY